MNNKIVIFLSLFLLMNMRFLSVYADAQTSQKEDKCIQLKRIDLTENALFPKEKQDKLFAPYLGKCITAVMLKKILHTTSQYYIDQGYITTKPYLTQQNIKDGRLKINILKGKIENIVNSDTNQSSCAIATAFILQKGRVLNLRNLETSLEMMNRPPSVDAKFDIVPGTKPGSSIVKIKTKRSFPIYGTLGIVGDKSSDNGNPYETANISIDNLLHINDILTFQYNTTQYQKKYQSSSGHQIDYSFPIGSYLISLSWFDSKYDQNVAGLNATYLASGDTKGSTTQVSKVLFRNQHNKWTLALSVQNKDTRNYFENELINVSSYSTTIAQVDVTHLFLQSWGQLSTTYSFYRGTDWFGAKSDGAVPGSDLKLQFTKYSIDMNLVARFLNAKYQINSNLHLQYTNDLLYDDDELGIGGYYTVRGYSSSYYGNNDWYSRNDFLRNFYPSLNAHVLQVVSPFIGIDYGEVRCQSNNAGSCGAMAGEAIGLQTQGKTFSTEFSWSRALKKVPGQKIENFFRYSMTLQF